MENVNTNNATTNRAAITLNVANADFNPVGEVAITTTNELCKIINDIFVNTYDDYYGCSINVQFNQASSQFIVTPILMFRILRNDQYINDDNHVYGFNPINVANGVANSVLTRVQNFSNVVSSTGPKVVMTEELKDVLKDFVLGNDINKFDWNTCYGTQVAGDNTFVKVFKLDILKFLKLIYGAKDDKGGECYYQPSIIRPITTQDFRMPDNWAVSILRLNWSNEVYAAQQQGFMVTPNNAPMNFVAAKR